MSYCVNCGVELDKTCSVCPLCNTKVMNPNEPVDTVSPKPWPSSRGSIEQGIRRDLAILVTICLATTAIVCGMLNLTLLNRSHWSLYVIGICVVLWIFCLPVFFPSKLNPHVSLLFDGIIIALYFGIISWLHPGRGWYYAIALPLIALGTVMVQFFVFCLQHPRRSILSQAVVLVAEIGILSISIELLYRHYLSDSMAPTWSAIVLTCCIIIDAALITILLRSRLREEVRRRMHI